MAKSIDDGIADGRARVRRVRDRVLDVCADHADRSLGVGLRLKGELDHADLLLDIAASHRQAGGLDTEARRRVREAAAVTADVWAAVRPRRRQAAGPPAV